MSLITDLLSKVKHEEQKKDIPPGLKDTIIQSVEQKRSRNRMILPVLLAVIVLLAGAAAVFYVSSVLTPARPVAPQPVALQAPPPAAPVAQTTPEAQAAQTSASNQALKEQQADSEASSEPPVKIKSKKSSGRMARAAGAAPAMHESARTKHSAAAPSGEKDSGAESQLLSSREKDELTQAARSYEAQRDYPRALAGYKKALAADPGNYILMNNIAGVLIRMEQYSEAIRYGERALSIRRNHIPSLINLGIAYNKTGRSAEGEGCFQQALSIEPTNRYALLNLGLLNEKRNSFDKGIQYFSKLAERSDCQGYLGLARIAEKQGKTANAVNYYRMALGAGNVDARTRTMINNRLMQITLTP